jgi:hypothetical protein
MDFADRTRLGLIYKQDFGPFLSSARPSPSRAQDCSISFERVAVKVSSSSTMSRSACRIGRAISKSSCVLARRPRCRARARPQSERTRRRSPRALTSPASWIAPPNSSNFPVNVVLPASGCETIANVRRRKSRRSGCSSRITVFVARRHPTEGGYVDVRVPHPQCPFWRPRIE